jgi:predicted phosphodiesterase
MNIINKHKEYVISFLGDIHGNFDIINQKIKRYDLNKSIIFQCGDFGVGFNYNNPRSEAKEHKRLLILNSYLKKRDIYLYVIRGNHDNPVFFDGKHNYTNIIFMQDYDIVDVDDVRVLGIGGAVSVDRMPNEYIMSTWGRGSWEGRKKDIDWWVNEGVVYDEEKIKNIFGVNIVFAHTCPDFAYPVGMDYKNLNLWFKCDKNLKEDLIKERKTMSKIFKDLDKYNPLEYYIYGHYHQTNTENINGTKFCLLDIDELREIKKNI